MKAVFAVCLAALAVLALATALQTVVKALDKPPTAAQYAAESATIEALQRASAYEAATFDARVQTAHVWLWALPGAFGLLVAYLTALGAAHSYRAWHERHPNAAGLLPVQAAQLATLAPAALDNFHAARQLEAQRPNVPHSLSYAPHTIYQNRGATELASSEAAPVQAALPGVTDWANIDHSPSKSSILLGLTSDGPVTVRLPDLVHCALVGSTGAGKSNLLRLLLPQILASGGQVVLANPHHADHAAGDDWRPIVGRLQQQPAVNAVQIAALLGYLCGELDRRLEARRESAPLGPPLFLALDELPIIASQVPDALTHLGRILREGRKAGLFVVGASQSMLVKTLGGDATLRDAYRTCFYVGGDGHSAAALLDMPRRDLDERALQEGVAYLRCKAFPSATLVRVPFASDEAVARALGPVDASATHTVSQFDAAPGPTAPAAPQRPEVARVCQMFASGLDVPAIVLELHGVPPKGGAKYQHLSREVQALLREALRTRG